MRANVSLILIFHFQIHIHIHHLPFTLLQPKAEYFQRIINLCARERPASSGSKSKSSIVLLLRLLVWARWGEILLSGVESGWSWKTLWNARAGVHDVVMFIWPVHRRSPPCDDVKKREEHRPAPPSSVTKRPCGVHLQSQAIIFEKSSDAWSLR